MIWIQKMCKAKPSIVSKFYACIRGRVSYVRFTGGLWRGILESIAYA